MKCVQTSFLRNSSCRRITEGSLLAAVTHVEVASAKKGGHDQVIGTCFYSNCNIRREDFFHSFTGNVVSLISISFTYKCMLNID